MTFRNDRPVLALAMMGLAAFLLAIPTVASADPGYRRARAEDGRGRDGHRDGDRADHRDDHRGDHQCDHRVARGHRDGVRYYARGRHHRGAPGQLAKAAAHRRSARRSDHQHHAAPFYCGPCHHRFASRDDFHRHLCRDHHVAPRLLSRVIVHHPFGWIFFG